jgi:sulfatase maturation enzyme AslB (radical SAM superfamily)
MNPSNDIFCPIPWISYAVRNDGKVRVCCHANQGPNHGLLFNSHGDPITYKDEIDSTRNSQRLKSIRVNFLRNKWDPECIRCKKEYILGLRSRNIYASSEWNKYITKDYAAAHTNSDGSINLQDFPLRHFDLRFGNLCNLKCRMCSGSDSNAWYSEQFKVLNNPTINFPQYNLVDNNGTVILQNDPFQWHEEDIFWDNLSSKLNDMRFCYLVGGEPLLIKKHYNFLKKCIEKGNAKDIEIEYNTNLTIVPEYAYELWSEFKNINFGVSIDGIGKVNDYIRYPSKWDLIEKNFRKIDNMGDNVSLWISCTVMVYNILYFSRLLEWALEQNFNKMKYMDSIASHPLHTPSHLNIKIFPENSKMYIKDLLIESINKINKSSYNTKIKKKHETILNSYIRYMFQEDLSCMIPDFWAFNNKIDEARNQKIEDYLPGLKELLEQ